MAEITAAAVAQLREMTNAGMMDCKKALTEAKGDLQAAVDILRKKGAATATTKGAKEAREGVIAQYITPDGRLGVLAEINCQTDFVARNDMFRAFAEDVVRRLATDPNADFEAERVAMVAKIRENIRIARHQRMEVQGNGLIAAYIHTGSKVGVLVEVGAGQETTVANDEFKQLVKDITLQIAAGHPLAVSREQVPPAHRQRLNRFLDSILSAIDTVVEQERRNEQLLIEMGEGDGHGQFPIAAYRSAQAEAAAPFPLSAVS